MVVRITGIVLNGALEIVGGSFLTAASGDDSEIVVDLREWEADGDKFKRVGRLVEISMGIGDQPR